MTSVPQVRGNLLVSSPPLLYAAHLCEAIAVREGHLLILAGLIRLGVLVAKAGVVRVVDLPAELDVELLNASPD